MRKILLLLPDYSQDKPMTILPDLGQEHETCGEVKLVKWELTYKGKKMKENKSSNRRTIKIKQKVTKFDYRVP